MARKSKRQVRRTIPKVSSEVAERAGGRASEREFNPDYSAVIKDLKRIGILAASFFVVLIVLSFFLG